jgi:crossover junction endodeoxyribonuclease RuvC
VGGSVETPTVVASWRVPLLDRKGKPSVDTVRLVSIVGSVALVHLCQQAIIEDVGAMPGQGVVSMFRFGLVTGILRGVLAASGISAMLIRPAAWKAALHLPADKEAARRLASDLFGTDKHWPRRSDHGIAEAALIGYVGLKMTKGL